MKRKAIEELEKLVEKPGMAQFIVEAAKMRLRELEKDSAKIEGLSEEDTQLMEDTEPEPLEPGDIISVKLIVPPPTPPPPQEVFPLKKYGPDHESNLLTDEKLANEMWEDLGDDYLLSCDYEDTPPTPPPPELKWHPDKNVLHHMQPIDTDFMSARDKYNMAITEPEEINLCQYRMIKRASIANFSRAASNFYINNCSLGVLRCNNCGTIMDLFPSLMKLEISAEYSSFCCGHLCGDKLNVSRNEKMNGNIEKLSGQFKTAFKEGRSIWIKRYVIPRKY